MLDRTLSKEGVVVHACDIFAMFLVYLPHGRLTARAAVNVLLELPVFLKS